MLEARRLRVQGVVQGVGFRPFVYRLALERGLVGWVQNDAAGLEAHLEGAPDALESFLAALERERPPAARIERLEVESLPPEGHAEFSIRQSSRRERPTVRISADIAVCDDCLRELFDPEDRRFGYPFINCTNCGPRYSIVLALPYDRERTTMRDWPMCPDCEREYHDPGDRRFHAQPTACPACGPHLELRHGGRVVRGDRSVIEEAARLLRKGQVLAVKGIGGYHLACDARNAGAVQGLRERKFRKEKPFALMARDLEVAWTLVALTPDLGALLNSSARPIVLAPAISELPGAAPDHRDLGLMLPYTPLHHLLFAQGAPEVLVLTSANRSNEPITYRDEDALGTLTGIADAFLIGERAIARRVDDSVIGWGRLGPMVHRRARGLAPAAVCRLPAARPILGVGADLKNSVTLVVNAQALVSQHVGDLDHLETLEAFSTTINDLLEVHDLRPEDTIVAHDAHPQYRSTLRALELPGRAHVAVQHHRAHIASVLGERQAVGERGIGVALDGTGYGDDGSIWGGEFFVGSLQDGFDRVAHLETTLLPGGDAAARFPVQAAAGFLAGLATPDLSAPPFHFPDRYRKALELLRRGVRCHPTSSAGRLFDTLGAICGFTREISFEGQAAIWLEHLAWQSPTVQPYGFGFDGCTLEYRSVLEQAIHDRAKGRDPREIARAFHAGLALGVSQAALKLCEEHRLGTVVLSGGVMQNGLLLDLILEPLTRHGLKVWTNHEVPCNDGGISLGQAAIAAVLAEAS